MAEKFKLNLDTRSWFKHLRSNNQLSMDFDIYYFCLMAGLACKHKSDASGPEFVDYFPGNYKANGHIIVALLIKTELELLKINMTEKKSVDETVRRLVSPSSPTCLSDEGFKLMDSYAHGGFEKIREWFNDDQPRSIEIFLPRYKKQLSEAFKP